MAKKKAMSESAKMGLVQNHIQGRKSANAESLAASYGLKIDDVRSILKSNGVEDDG